MPRLLLHGFLALSALTAQSPGSPQTLPTQYGSACPSTSSLAADLLRDAQSLLATNAQAALHCFVRAADVGAAESNPAVEAQARFGFARAAYEGSMYDIVGAPAERALALFEAAGDRPSAARVMRLLGSTAFMRGNRDVARRHLDRALQSFSALGMDRERALVLVDLARMSTDGPEATAYVEEAIALTRRIVAPDIEAIALHNRSDKHFSSGRFDAAIADLTAAIALFEKTDSRRQLGDAYVSLGRILRAHGRAADALEYYDRAAAIQESLGNLQGLVQSINAKAIALATLDRKAESRAAYERALELAQRTGSPRIINFQKGNLAAAFADIGHYLTAIRLLDEVLLVEKDPYILAYRHSGLARHLAAIHEYERAAVHIEKAMEYGKQTNNRELLPEIFYQAAVVNRALHRTDAALAAAAAGVEAVELLRSRLVPLDFMKRGFADTRQDIFGVMIALRQERGEHANALAVSEQARARAFLDLLASRELVKRPAESPGPLGSSDEGATPLASHAAATPASAEDIAATARRMHSVILSYWVSNKEIFIWVAAPGGVVRSARVSIAKADLEKAIAAAMPSRASVSSDSSTRLYRLLVRPVSAWLPRNGASLTIVPHGPLFRLSFAALRDEAGKYLIERYALTYAPSVSALLSIKPRASSSTTGGGYLLVADPSPLPPSPHPLDRLPASRHEASLIRAVLGGNGVLLSGTLAGESKIRERASSARILHFATHGVIRDDEPFDSFLAVGADGSGTSADGRLTVREIYDLPLSADLVVLSACRTATGPLSGDGIAGLSRALFYAGALSVVATLWDVADEPSARLMAGFYRHWRRGLDKRSALRQAQLDLLRELRAGSVTVKVRGGVVPLQERPFYWAGYVLIGQP